MIHIKLRECQITIGTTGNPEKSIRVDFNRNEYAELYESMDNFKKEYYGYNSLIGGTQINYASFKSLYPLMVFDVRRQSDALKSGVSDIKIEFLFHEALPGNINAHVVILSDSLYELSSDGSRMDIVRK